MTIRRRILLVNLLTLIPMLMLVIGLLLAWYAVQRDLIANDRVNNALLVATAFKTTVDDISSASIAVGESVIASAPGTVAHPALERLVSSYPLQVAAIVDRNGRVTHASDAALVGESVEDTAVARVLGGADSAVGVDREVFGRTGFVIAQRVGPSDETSAIAVQLVDNERLSARLGANQIAGGAHIVDSAGQLVAIFEYPELSNSRQMWGRYGFINDALEGRQSVDFDWTFPPTGVRRVAAAVPIPDIGWEAGSAVDYEVAFAPFQRSLAVALAAGLLVLVVSVMATRMYGLRLVNAVEALCRQSEVVGRREEPQAPIVETGDEIEQVSRALARADGDLRAYIGGIEMIGEAGRQLSASFTTGRVHDTIVNAARRLFDATAVWVFLYDEESGMLQPTIWYSESGTPGPTRPIRPGEGVAGRVYSSGEIALIPDVSKAEGFSWRRAEPGVRADALVEIPLTQSRRSIGVLGVFAPGIEQWQLGGREVGLLTAFGTQVSIALQNARLYENERMVAETLQQALLLMPERVEGVDFAHAYFSGTGELRVGGDFYDLFEMGEDRVGILLGDVSGKGLQAAVLTSLVKDTIRAHADEPNKTPAEVAALTNQLLVRQSPPDMFVTLFLGYLDADGRLSYCNAGHTTGALLGPDGTRPLPSTSPVVGVFEEFEYEQAEIVMGPQDTLLLYTDGLTEARSGTDLYGEERLFELLDRIHPISPEWLLDEIYRQVLLYANGQLSDDLALLAVTCACRLYPSELAT